MRQFLLAVLLAGLPLTAVSQTPDTLPFTLGTPEANHMPSAGPLQTRRISHLFWDAQAGAIAQRQFEIRDRFGGPELEVTWQPQDAMAAALRPTGNGTLTWRRAGTAPYDTRAIVALYRGALVDGALHGTGEFWHRSGLSYAGEFENGLFSGHGRLQHPGGDYYEGRFRDGLYHGPGRLVAADGSIFEGTFVAGAREGAGLTAPADRRAYTSLWRAGDEVAGQRKPLDGAEGLAHLKQVQAISYPDAVLGVSVNQSLPQGVSPDWVTLYRGMNDGRRLRIEPGDPEMMAQWLGTGPLPVSDYWGASPFWYERFQPVSLTVALNYSGSRPTLVTGGWIEVIESQPIERPAIELRRGSYCGLVSGDMSITNHVAVPLEGGHVEFWAGGIANLHSEVALPTDTYRMEVVPMDAVSRAGIDLGWLSENLLACNSRNAADCIDRIRASGRFAELSDRIYGSGSHVLVDVPGRLHYSAPDASGQRNTIARDFTVPVKVGAVFEDRSECGAEMSEALNLRENPFMFEARGSNYRLPYSLEARVMPGTQQGWVFQFDAPVPSRHLFQVYLQLADGRTVATREVDLTYFTHRFELEDS